MTVRRGRVCERPVGEAMAMAAWDADADADMGPCSFPRIAGDGPRGMAMPDPGRTCEGWGIVPGGAAGSVPLPAPTGHKGLGHHLARRMEYP